MSVPKPLSPMERWMLKSNLQTVAGGVPAEKQAATLRANGYHRLADALLAATQPK